jgi:signal transduction histidine kinase/DNA-binding response OmpR family regulator/HPt (histidine-containing phosphotransfer) domain-containing protein
MNSNFSLRPNISAAIAAVKGLGGALGQENIFRAEKDGLSPAENSAGSYRLPNFSSLCIAFFGLIQMTVAFVRHDTREFIVVSLGVIAALMILALCRSFFRSSSLAFYEPLMLYLAWIITALILRDFSNFFIISIGVCYCSMSYLNSRKFLRFIIVLHLINLALVLFRFPTMGATPMSFDQSLISWVFQVFMSVFMYMTTKFTSEKLKAATRAEEYLDSLLSTSTDRVVLLDPEDRVAYMSDSLVQFTGLHNAAAAVGKPVLPLITDAGIKKMFAGILRKKSDYTDVREITLNGETYYFKIISKNLLEKTGGRYINFVDVTPEMTAKFKAEAASQSKSAFLATISHEIRTPLNAVIGLSEIELQKELSADARDNLEKIYNSGSSLLSIINDMLDISKIEAGNMELIPVIYDVADLIDDAVRLNIVRIGSKNIVFHLVVDETIPAKLFGDELRVKQIVNNLLSNAFKYTGEGKVQMDVGWEKEGENAWLTIQVGDTGQGIKEENIDKIFTKYYQLDTQANRHIEGTGLGLPIAKQLTEMMDGDISVESVYSQGTVFRVRIRQVIIDEKPVGKETAESLMAFRFMKTRRRRSMNLVRAHMPYGKVLVVDDVSTNLDVMRGLLLPYGLRIDCAGGGEEAVEKVRRATTEPGAPRYDMIFMDHMMPGMDGIEAVRIIRNEINADPRLEELFGCPDYAKNVPIIALTANALNGNREMFLSKGFNGFISKPIDLIQLDAVLNTWIRNKQNGDILRQAEAETREEPAKNDLPEGWRIEGVDLERGRKYYSGNDYLKILRSFCTHTPALLEKLRAAPEEESPGSGDLAEYAVTVHGLKGSCFGICADKAGVMAQVLENAAKAGDVPTLRKKTPAFTALVEKMMEDLETLLAEFAPEGDKQRAPAPDGVLLEALLTACRYYRLSEMEEIMAKLETKEYEKGGKLIAELRKQMENLDYEAMTEILEQQNNNILEEQT